MKAKNCVEKNSINKRMMLTQVNFLKYMLTRVNF
jgi:hypothetical protein